MATATQDVIRRSYIQVVTSNSKLTFLNKKKRWVILYKDSMSGPSRLELYRKEDDANTPPMVIKLDTITSVVSTEGKKEFVISFDDSQVTFACEAHADVDDWISDINRCRGVAETPASNGTTVYDAIPGDEVFAVRLRRSQSLTYQGSCILEIEKNFERNQFHIALYTEQSPRRLIVKWQIDHIRQYGSNETAFKFQSGSKSSTGVDWFVMDTESGVAAKVHRAVDYWAKYIVQQIRNTPAVRKPPPPSIAAPSKGASNTPSAASVYEPLIIENRKENSVYDSVVTEGSGHRLSMHQNPANPSQGQYQPLKPLASSPPPSQESQYVSLNPSTRESRDDIAPPVIPPRIPVPSRSGNQSTYMELNSETRENVEPSYMGLNAK